MSSVLTKAGVIRSTMSCLSSWERLTLRPDATYTQWYQLFCRFSLAEFETTDVASVMLAFRDVSSPTSGKLRPKVSDKPGTRRGPDWNGIFSLLIRSDQRSVRRFQHGPSDDGNESGGTARRSHPFFTRPTTTRNSSRRNIASRYDTSDVYTK